MSAHKKALNLLVSSLDKGAGGCNGEWELLGSALLSSSIRNQSVRTYPDFVNTKYMILS